MFWSNFSIILLVLVHIFQMRPFPSKKIENDFFAQMTWLTFLSLFWYNLT